MDLNLKSRRAVVTGSTGGIGYAAARELAAMGATVAINGRTGDNVGVIAQLHFYLDDLFPHSLGRPLFGGKK